MSYVGSAEQDEVRKIVQDPTGNYLVGSSSGFTGWPSSTSPIYQGGTSDAFVIRLSDDHEPLWHKSLGGTDADFAFDEPTRRLNQDIREIVTAARHRPIHPESSQHKAFLEKYYHKTLELSQQHPGLDFEKELSYFKD
jgi:hypothetical protein